MDAANVDLKAFTERFYEKRCAGKLEPVLETLKYLVHETSVWTEITTLSDPGRERRRRGTRRADEVGGEGAQPRRAAALHRLPPRLSHARHRADAASDPAAGAGDRARERPASRLRRQPAATRRARRPSARPAGRAASGATVTKSPSIGSTPRAAVRAAGREWPACSPPGRDAGARDACRCGSSATRREASNGGRGACVTGKRGSAGGRAGCPQTRSGEFWYAATREDDGAALSSRRSTSRRAWRSSPARRSACPLRQADNDGIQSRAI